MNFLYEITIALLEKFLGICLAIFYGFIGDYGISIILLSIVVNIILIPLYYLADKWKTAEVNIQEKMSAEIDSIKKYYTGQKRYYQIKAVYRRYGYNPLYALRVSLGLLIQIPFFFAAYHYLSNYKNLNGASFLIIKNLGSPDQLLYGLNILPIIMTIFNVASGILYSKNMTNGEKVQLHSLSIVFLILLYSMPSGLVLYWTTNNVISLIKNIIRVIKIQKRPIFTSMITKRSLPELIDIYMVSRYTRYFVFVLLLIAVDFATFYYLFVNKKDALSNLSLKATILLLFITIAIIAPGYVKRRTQVFRDFILFYLSLLVATSIGPISVGKLLQTLEIIQNVTYFVLFVQTLIIFMLLYDFVMILREKYGVDIFKSVNFIASHEKKNFTTSMIFFNIILFIWGPSLTVHSGPNEFYISFIYILLWQFFFFSVSIAMLFALYHIVPRPLKIFITFVLQYLSITAIIYIAFYRRDIGLMNDFWLNVPSNLDLKSHEMFIDVLVIFSIFVCLILILKDANDYVYRIISYTSIIMLLSSAYFTSDIMYSQYLKRKNDSNALANYQLTLAKGKNNVLIFMLDGFSGGTLKIIENNSRELFNDFDGFTWYKNVLTVSTSTLGSIATIFGGHKYSIEEINSRVEKKPLIDYYVEAYNVYPRAFKPLGYKVKYFNPPYVNCSEIKNNAECYKNSSNEFNSYISNTEVTYNIYNEAVPLLVNSLTIFKAIPHSFKKSVYDHGMYHGIRNKIIDPDWIYETNFFLNIANRIKVTDESTFNFIYLQTPSPPNKMDSQCNFITKNENRYTNNYYINESYCVIKTISKIISRMKELQVYENTMIVLVSDHGWWWENKMFKENYTEKVSTGYEGRLISGMINPLLMVKDINSRGKFLSSELFLSNADLPSIVCSVIDSCNDIPIDIRKYRGERKLIVTNYSTGKFNSHMSDIGYKGIKERYEVTNNIFDGDNWRKID